MPQSNDMDYENGFTKNGNEKTQRYNYSNSNGCLAWLLDKKQKVTKKLPKLSKTQLRLLVAAKIFMYFVQFLILHWLFSKWFPKKYVGRSETDAILNEIPLIFSIFDNPDRSIGGWKSRYTQQFYQLPPLSKASKKRQTVPDFGGLYIFRPDKNHREFELSNFESSKERRLIGGSKAPLAAPRKIQSKQMEDKLAKAHFRALNDNTYSYIRSREEWPEDIEDVKTECRHPGWARKPKPSCNAFHEMVMSNWNDKQYVSHGDFRDVWLLDHFPLSGNPYEDVLYQTALKMTRYYIDYEREQYWGIIGDANVMEALTASPRIVDIYGYCGGSVWVEPMPGDIVSKIVYDKGEGLIKPEKLDDKKELKPQNEATTEEKLDMALTFAESLADLHGYHGGVIVHDDIQLAQWLKTPNKTIKFGDFNRMVALPYNSKTGKYCKYRFNSRPWRYRSPEEYESYLLKNKSLGWMNEQIDTYSYGNTIYALLTGLWPFYDMDDDKVVSHKVINGSRPFVDPRYRHRKFIEKRMVDIMEECWKQDPEERISIFEVVKQLRDVKKEYYDFIGLPLNDDHE